MNDWQHSPNARYWPRATAGYMLIVLFLLGDVLFLPGDRVAGMAGGDLTNEFMAMRAFGFSEVASGRIPYWNPHQFGGAPFLGEIQTAIWYPPNWIFLLLPLAKALNWSIALHAFLLAVSMYAWARSRMLAPLPAFFAGALVLLWGGYAMRIGAGHLSDIATLAWAPAIWLALDGIIDNPGRRWLLIGAAAFSFQILSGHVQYVYYELIAALVYVPLRLHRAHRPIQATAALAVAAAGALALTAAQVWTMFEANAETVRAGALPYDIARSYAFPPENICTSVAPFIFGDGRSVPYWGRWYLSECTVFIGVVGLLFGLAGVSGGPRRARWPAMAVVPTLAFLAVSSYTPAYRLLYDWAPYFGSFRGTAKFASTMGPFLALVCGAGLQRMLEAPLSRRWWLACCLAGLTGLAGAVYLHQYDDTEGGLWPGFVKWVVSTGESEAEYSGALPPQAALQASRGLAVAGAVGLVAGMLVFLRGRSRWAAVGLAGLGLLELMGLAHSALLHFNLGDMRSPLVQRLFAEHGKDYRIWYLGNPHYAMLYGGSDLWGHHLPLRRYAEYVAVSQGLPRAAASERIEFRRDHPMLDYLLCRYIIRGEASYSERARMNAPESHWAWLAGDSRVIREPDARLAALSERGFDGWREAIVEVEPVPSPTASGADGRVRILERRPGRYRIECSVPDAALLIVAENYAAGWRARGATGEGMAYTVLAADHTLIGIPVGAGEHEIILEYRPRGFIWGRWISIVAVVLWLIGVAREFRRTNDGD